MTTAFETESCSRCGGSGHYSFNGTHSRCYKCDGKNDGQAYTKRGRAAKDFYLALKSVVPTNVKIGDKIRTLNFKQLTVAEITRSIHPMMSKSTVEGFLFTNEHGKADWVSNNGSVHLIPSAEQNESFIAQALAYQATLTKAGKPRK